MATVFGVVVDSLWQRGINIIYLASISLIKRGMDEGWKPNIFIHGLYKDKGFGYKRAVD